MTDQFTFCHKCGRRNFSDDKICGICNTELVAQGINNETSPKKNNYYLIAISIGALIFLYYSVLKKDQPNETTITSDRNAPQGLPTPIATERKFNDQNYSAGLSKKSPEVLLAIINDETPTPDKTTISYFSQLLRKLQERYSNSTKNDIANALVAAHNIIVKEGESDSLLEFSTAFNAYSKEIDRKFDLSVEEALVLFIRISYKI